MKPLVVGRGPWAQNIFKTLEELKVPYTIAGKVNAAECIHEARGRGNDAVIIATPLSSHYDLAAVAIRADLPLFLEKPATSTLHELEALHRIAQDGYGVLRQKFLVNSIHLFAEGAEKMVAQSKLGLFGKGPSFVGPLPPKWVHASFGGPGPDRPDCPHWWDYGWHPLSLLYALGVDLSQWHLGLLSDLVVMESPCVKTEGFEEPVSHYHVSTSNQWPQKQATFIASWSGSQRIQSLEPEWELHGGVWWQADPGADPRKADVYKMSDAPPLKRALSLFLDQDYKWHTDYRFGFELPLAVTKCLESLGPSAKK